MIEKENVFIISAYILFTLILSHPLIFHLNGFLLSENYSDISHSDTMIHLGYIRKAGYLSKNLQDPIIIDPSDVPQTYIFPGLFATEIFHIDEVVYHNLFFLYCIFISGYFMYLLMFELSGDKISSFFSGFLYMSPNFLFYEYMWGHTNIMQIQWIPLILLFLERTLKYKKIRDSICLGFSLSLQIVSSSQYTVYLTFILPLYLFLRIYFSDKNLFFDRNFWDKIVFSKILISLEIAFLLSSYFLVKRLTIFATVRSIQDNLTKSWRMTSINQLFHVNTHISLGIIQMALVLIGLAIIYRKRDNSLFRRFIPLPVLMLFLILAMYGPTHPLSPYSLLLNYWPFVNRFRVPRRIFPFILICSSILSSLGLIHLKEIESLKKYRIHILVLLITLIITIQILQSPWLSNHQIYYP
jgi:hypothetical protein